MTNRLPALERLQVSTIKHDHRDSDTLVLLAIQQHPGVIIADLAVIFLVEAPGKRIVFNRNTNKCTHSFCDYVNL